MDNKTIMANSLICMKGLVGLLHHGAVEAQTPNIRSQFVCALNSSLSVQNAIYNAMRAAGMYPDSDKTAPQAEIDNVKNKFAQIKSC